MKVLTWVCAACVPLILAAIVFSAVKLRAQCATGTPYITGLTLTMGEPVKPVD